MRLKDTEILISTNGDQKKTLRYIDRMAARGASHPFVLNSIKKYNLGNDLESLQSVLDAAFKTLMFHPDPPGQQYIRTLNRSLKDRRGNCVDYTVFISAFLRALKTAHLIRMVSFDPNAKKAYSHIYPLTTNGIVLDAVYGQRQDGTEFEREGRKAIFNKEVPFSGNFDKLIRA